MCKCSFPPAEGRSCRRILRWDPSRLPWPLFSAGFPALPDTAARSLGGNEAGGPREWVRPCAVLAGTTPMRGDRAHSALFSSAGRVPSSWRGVRRASRLLHSHHPRTSGHSPERGSAGRGGAGFRGAPPLALGAAAAVPAGRGRCAGGPPRAR